MPEPQRRYWAFCANPRVYKIEQVVHERREDDWIVRRGEVRAGDRAIIWKAKGNQRDRGIVALAEVLTDPAPGIPKSDYWIDQQAANEVVDRVRIRYVVPPTLPLWLGATDLPVLRELSVARATGGTVFHVTPGQWDSIMKLVGGWPARNPDLEEVERTLDEYAGKKRSGQGFATNADVRRAIEQYAMQKAKAFYEERGWNVFDVATTHSYDLLCKTDDGEELHVEVKGTTFTLSRIQVDPTSSEKPQAGEMQILEPWNVDEGTLSPLAFTYNLPEKNV